MVDLNGITLILFGVSVLLLVTAISLMLVKFSRKESIGTLGVAIPTVMSFICLIACAVIIVPGMVSQESDLSIQDEKLYDSEINIKSKEIDDEISENDGETETNFEEVVASGEDVAEINEADPLKIAWELVEQEMSKQVGLKSWEIVENTVTSDTVLSNISDYDKPAGDMRKVWIEGYVYAVSEDGGEGNVGYTLELYQMKGDSKWYIGNHWGVLRDLIVTEQPVVEEDEG